MNARREEDNSSIPSDSGLFNVAGTFIVNGF